MCKQSCRQHWSNALDAQRPFPWHLALSVFLQCGLHVCFQLLVHVFRPCNQHVWFVSRTTHLSSSANTHLLPGIIQLNKVTCLIRVEGGGRALQVAGESGRGKQFLDGGFYLG